MTQFAEWIGRHEVRHTRLDASRSRVLLAAMGRPDTPDDGDPLPPLHHWLNFWDAVTPARTGEDGHLRRGGFLPPVPLPRRMWAGGRLVFHGQLLLGAEVRRVSTIVAIKDKQGRSGRLVFVTVRHDIFSDDRLALEEEQDIVYREPAGAAPDGRPPGPARGSAGDGCPEVLRVTADPVLLFRYSALTMNSHRIHYDRRYAIEAEGYRDIVVQGPLQATLLADLAARRFGRPLASFEFRGLSPAVAGHPLALHAAAEQEQLQLYMSQCGIRTMAARAAC